MIFQRKKVAAALACVIGAGGAMAVSGAYAQARNPDVPSNTRPDIRVDVTGSNIKRVEAEGALPVQVITRADLEREGLQTAAAVVDRLSSNSSIGGLNLPASEGSTGTGYASASLRGLGGSRTLVLLNGRRLANTAFSGTTVDINSIPLSAIERVEVLTDGASAIYGTDAIAGVINFILRKDYQGVEASAYYGDSERGGGETQRYNVSAGWGDLARDKFNIWGTVDYNKIQAIAANQRDFSKSSYIPNQFGYDKTSGNSIPGNVFIPLPDGGGTTRNPANPACLPPFSFPTEGSPNQCRFDYASVIDIVPPSESWNLFGGARWQFAPDHQAFFEAAWSRTESIARVSPPPISSATILSGEPVLTIPSSPFYPHALAQQFGVDGQDLEVFWRGLELGPRTDKNTIEQQRYVAGLQGVLFGWDYSAGINYSKSKATDEWLAGWSKGSVLLPILNSGQINLFGLNSPEAVSLMRNALITGPVIQAEGTSTEFDARVSKDVWKLPAGSLAVALGATYRREEYQFDSSQATQEADVPGLGGSIASVPNVKRNVWAVYGEAVIPIVKNLEADVAVRYDDYQNVGNTTNPKVSLRWQPTRQILLRASYGTGFRAPGLPELFAPNSYGATGGTYDDPLRCPFTGSPRDCNAQFTTQLGGNPALKPERSTNWTAGIVVEPVGGYSFGVDYWNIEIKDVIGLPAETPIFTDMPAAEAAGLLVRYDPGSAGCVNAGAGLPCPVNFGIQNLVNLTTLKTSGIDFNANMRFPLTPIGQFSFDFNGTYYIEWKQKSFGQEEQNLIGQYGGGVAATVAGSGSTGGFPRWKHNANFAWMYGPWSANLHQTYVHSYKDDPTFGDRTVGALSFWDLSGAYTGFKNWTLAIGVKNLFDRDPPFSIQTNAFQIGYDPALADPTGRFWWGSVKYTFK
jgi:iron complex outermembrane receptor protein